MNYKNNILVLCDQIRAVSNESGQARSNIAALKAELDETKQALQREREENNLMAYRIKSLREELEHAKKELKHLKSRDSFQKQILNPEIEDVKFVENVSTKRNNDPDEDEDEDDEEGFEFHKKTTRFVKFASPPLLTRVIEDKEMLERPPSVKKKNRKPLVSLVGWLFSKKKDRQADQEGSFHQI